MVGGDASCRATGAGGAEGHFASGSNGRVTLRRASSIEEAIALAETEAEEYAQTKEESASPYLGLAQGYALADRPGHGAEIFSLLRSSDLDGEDYLDQFFDTGHEHEQHS